MFGIILIINVVSFLFSAYLTFYAFKLKQNKTALVFSILMAIFTFWSFINIIGFFINSLAILENIFIFKRGITTFTPALILYLVIKYTQYPRWFSKKHTIILFTYPTILAVFSIFDNYLRLFTSDFKLHFDYDIPHLMFVELKYDFLFQYFVVGCLFFSILILSRNLFRGSKFFNMQILLILFAILIPAVSDFLYRVGFSIIPNYNLIPEMFIVGNIFFAFALFNFQFLKLEPVPNNMIINSINDIIITFNDEKLLFDINKSGNYFFNFKTKNIIGKSIYDVFQEYTSLLSAIEIGISKEIEIVFDNQVRYFMITHSYVSTKKINVVMLYDISNSKVNFVKESRMFKHNISNERAEELKNTIIKLFEEEKIHLNKNLTLQDLAEKVGINRVQLSQLINELFNVNFNILVNQYRIKSSILIIEKNYKIHTMNAIAEASGFSSKSTFYIAFKKQIGETPTDYIKKNITFE